MSNVIQHTVVDGLPDVAHWPLRIGRSNNFMWARRVLIGGQDADLPPRHLLFVNIDGLKGDKHWLKLLADRKHTENDIRKHKLKAQGGRNSRVLNYRLMLMLTCWCSAARMFRMFTILDKLFGILTSASYQEIKSRAGAGVNVFSFAAVCLQSKISDVLKWPDDGATRKDRIIKLNDMNKLFFDPIFSK